MLCHDVVSRLELTLDAEMPVTGPTALQPRMLSFTSSLSTYTSIVRVSLLVVALLEQVSMSVWRFGYIVF